MASEDERIPIVREEIPNGYGSISTEEGRSSDLCHKQRESQCGYNNGDIEQNGNLGSPVVTETTLARFWILLVFSVLSWLNCVLWDTFGPINESVEAAFPSWGPSTVAMTVNWTTIMFLIFVAPMCLTIQRCGLRTVVIVAAAILFLGTSLRCITTKLPWFTVLSDLCSMLVGVASTIILAGPSLIASEWFPLNERTTAVAVMMGSSQLGGVGSYLEPLLVQTPGHGVSPEEIRGQIMTLLYIGAGATGVLLAAILIYFPSRPPLPPSITSSITRLDMKSGVISLCKNKDFLLISLAYGISVGPPIAWIPVLNYSLAPLGFHQDHAMWIGLSSVLTSSLFPVVYGRIMDRFHEHMRTNLVFLMFLSSACFFWFLLLSYGTIPKSTWQVYVSVVGGLTLNYTTIPLFYELAAEIAYPVPEILVSAILTAADNLISTLFLSVFLVPGIGYNWVTIVLTICSSYSIIPLTLAKIRYIRTKLDLSDT
ncbi:solute carrier family 49 member 4 homolog [Palaemon carinicauda]|uniref:solute carrier family 49 member 4 homolog n=1 Tax=Palaemon carinicauda TaxID=392227 RepID=UPI0035B68FD8